VAIRVFLGLLAAGALSACATPAPTYGNLPPVVYGPQTRPPSGPTIYDTAPHAPVHSQLFVCNRWSSNLGEIGESSEAVLDAPYIESSAGSVLRCPGEPACLSSGCGWRGTLGRGRPHHGIDLANPEGGFVYAAGDGRVVRAEYYGGYGNTVELDHGRGVRTLYGHLSEIDTDLHAGDFVARGAPIARMGMTGNATGVHLHYEVWIGDLLVDPLHYGRPPIYVSAPAPEPLPIPDSEFVEPKPTY
jgi:murein DD-endopeptidase MepM/ murein hydrolase activator NlpD